MKEFDLSIIIPFYKGEAFIGRVLSSLQRAQAAASAEPAFEVLVIVDSPETCDVNRLEAQLKRDFGSLPWSLLRNEKNIGVAATRNRGLRESKGAYLYFIDQDDEVDVRFFDGVADVVRNQYDFVLINGTVESANSQFNNHLIDYLSPKLTLKNLILDDIIRSPGQVLLKRTIMKEFPVTAKHFGADDKILWVLIFLYHPGLKCHYIKEPLYKAHIHADNYSGDRDQLQLAGLEAWDTITQHHDTSAIDTYIRRNRNYLKFVVRNRIHLTLAEKVSGFYEWMLYFLRPNRLIRFYYKRFSR